MSPFKKTASISRLVTLTATVALSAAFLSGCGTFGGNKKAQKQAAQMQAPNMGVNSYLWRAALETMEFMPADSADPFGGVITTDWYASPEAPTERFKANIYILDANLRADALKVSIFKQINNGGNWTDAAVDADTARQIENAILTRAREFYIATVDSQ